MEVLKQCSKCRKWLIATSEYFHKNSTKKCGLADWCKSCCKSYMKVYTENNADILRTKKALYRESIREKYKPYWKEHYAKNIDRYRKYNEDHAEERNAYCREYHKEHPEVSRRNTNKRRNIMSGLPNTMTVLDEKFAYDFWDHCCAVCGRKANEDAGINIALDHWIALSDPRPDNPGTVPTNMLPLCHGKGGCNNSKRNKDPIEWLQSKFPDNAQELLDSISYYFNAILNR